MKEAIIMDENDNVATALAGLDAGDKVEVISVKREVVKHVTVNNALPLGHKIASAHIPKEGRVVKYGSTIGKAVRDISVGDHVHIHNVSSDRFPLTEHMLGSK